MPVDKDKPYGEELQYRIVVTEKSPRCVLVLSM